MYSKNDIVRIKSGETCMIINTPGTFLSNGSYESIVVDMGPNNKYLPIFKHGKKIIKWLKESDIAYNLTNTDKSEELDHYFDIVYSGQEIDIKPKNHSKITLETSNDGSKVLSIHYENHLHNLIKIIIKNENNN